MYFNPSAKCLWNFDAMFQMANIHCTDEVFVELSEERMEWMKEEGFLQAQASLANGRLWRWQSKVTGCTYAKCKLADKAGSMPCQVTELKLKKLLPMFIYLVDMDINVIVLCCHALQWLPSCEFAYVYVCVMHVLCCHALHMEERCPPYVCVMSMPPIYVKVLCSVSFAYFFCCVMCVVSCPVL